MSSLAKKLIAATGKTSRADILSQSKFFDKQPLVVISTPIVAGLLSGNLDGGLTAGSTMLVGDSRTFKSNMCLYLVSEFMEKYKDAVCVFVDSEFGAAKAYFQTFNMDLNRIVHIPVEDIEQMTFEVVQVLDAIEKGEKVVFFIDSISQVSSKKEAADALEGKGTTDMTRARTLNSFWRIVTPKLNLKDIPLLAINSFYDDMTNKYAERHIKGGKQGFLSADAVWFVSRSKEKDEENALAGFTFNYSIMKSRFVIEGSKFPVRVTFEGGIDKYSGIWDLAREFDLVQMPSNAWYKVNPAVGETMAQWVNSASNFRKGDIENPVFFDALLKTPAFRKAFEDKYKLSGEGKMVQTAPSEYVVPDTGEVIKLGDD